MRATEFAQAAVSRVLKPGDLAIDATAGNGHDTLFLCERVGPQGKIVAFDIQDEALTATRTRLAESGIGTGCFELVCASHETMPAHAEHQTVAAIMFNLGYLPGGDKAIITRTASTLAALESALRLLHSGGVLTIVCYPGHEGGAVEAKAVSEWAEGLRERSEVQIHPQARPDAPFAVIVEASQR